MKPRPSFAGFNSGNSILPNAIFGGYFLLKSIVKPNSSNLLLGKFVRGASLSSIGSPMNHPVRLITSGGVPSQVVDLVVSWVAVVVATLHSFGTWAYKSLQNHPMNFLIGGLVVSPKQNKHPRNSAILYKCGWLFKGFGFDVSDISKVGNFVQVFKSKYWFPMFFHKLDYTSNGTGPH